MSVTTRRPSFRRLAAGFAGALLGTSLAFGTGGVGAAGGAPTSPVSNPASVFAPGPAGHAWTGTARDGSPLGTSIHGATTRDAGTVPTTTNPAVAANGAYTALAPLRLLDTRVTHQTLGPGGELSLTVTGGADSVPADSTAVTINVTVTDTSAAAWLAVFPAGGSIPLVSNLNWSAGQTVANLVIVPVGTGGQVTFYLPGGYADVVVDLEGYFAPEGVGTTAGSYVPLTPARIVDTRAGSGNSYAGDSLGTQGTLNVHATGEGGVPSSGVAGVLLNVTVVNTALPSYLTVFPEAGSQPTASNLNWPAGAVVPNRVMVPVNTAAGPNYGEISLFNDQGSVDVVVDVDGYFTTGSTTPTGASLLGIVSPVRVLDTRLSSQTLETGGIISLQLAGVEGIASNATAVVANVTTTDTGDPSFLTVYPGGTPPLASDLNWVPGQTEPNLTIATLSGTGTISAFNDAGSADLIIDAFGYFVPETPAPVVVLTATLPAASCCYYIGYSATLNAYGGTTPYTWSITSGGLPPGLSLSSGGVVSGQPTADSGSPYSLTVKVTDSSSTAKTATEGLSLAVHASSSGISTLDSSNWSGFATSGGLFTGVAGSFTVPSLDLGDPVDSCMAVWVGIDGLSGGGNLIQAGILECQINSTEWGYEPWWEILPASATPIAATTAQLRIGDDVTVSIDQVTGTEWSITLADDNTGWSFTTDQEYTGPATSAEWIVEAPSYGPDELYFLADYTETEFYGLGVTGQQNTLTTLPMAENTDGPYSTPSTMNNIGFNLAYGDVAPSPP
jgi:hypothetical protein